MDRKLPGKDLLRLGRLSDARGSMPESGGEVKRPHGLPIASSEPPEHAADGLARPSLRDQSVDPNTWVRCSKFKVA